MHAPPLSRLFALGFLALLGSVGVIQWAVEVGRGERPQALDLFRHPPTAERLRAYEQALEDASWVAHRLRPWMLYAQFQLFHSAGEKALLGRQGWWYYRPGVQFLTQRADPGRHPDDVTQAVEAIVAFRDQLAARGLRLLVLPVPNKESVYPDRLTRRSGPWELPPGAETRRLMEALRASDVELLDLFTLFARARSEATVGTPALYLTQDTHWSPAGVALAARAVAQHVLRSGWVEAGSAVYELRPAPVQRVGDLLRMLQVPAIERTIAPEMIPCEQVLHGDPGEVYRDEPLARVLVLGDSFLRIYQTDEPGGAGFVAHLARELRQPLTSLVSDGGASTLVRQDLFRRPALLRNKQLVIWEFAERDIRLGTEGWQRVPLPPDSP